jgi:hypothetical protein
VNAKPRSAEWFYNMRNEELYPGSKVIVLEQCFVLLGQKIKYKTKDTYVDELCRCVGMDLLLFIVTSG